MEQGDSVKDVRMPDFGPPAGATLMVGTSATQTLAIKTLFNAAWKALIATTPKGHLDECVSTSGCVVGEGGLEDGADLFEICVPFGRGVLHSS